MITVPTTFIVGAGASSVYGLPLGLELRNRAVKLRDDAAYDLIRFVTSPDAVELKRFIHELSNHPTSSIDDFLLTRQVDASLTTIGRATIASLMVQAIAAKKRHQFKPEDDWLAVIFERMRRGTTDFASFIEGNSSVRFVTFNFDSIIEDRLSDFVNRYCRDGCHKDKLLDRIPVIHVHGRLPMPNASLIVSPTISVEPAWTNWLQRAIKEIRIVHDQIDAAELKAARKAVKDAKVIVFLGMAYHVENLARLNVPGTLKPRKLVYGTSFKMPEVDTAFVSSLMHGKIKFEATECAPALRKLPWWRHHSAWIRENANTVGDSDYSD